MKNQNLKSENPGSEDTTKVAESKKVIKYRNTMIKWINSYCGEIGMPLDYLVTLDNDALRSNYLKWKREAKDGRICAEIVV